MGMILSSELVDLCGLGGREWGLAGEPLVQLKPLEFNGPLFGGNAGG